jgi:hypothetical protein
MKDEFGCVFLSPILNFYYQSVFSEDNCNLICLAREGWILNKLFNSTAVYDGGDDKKTTYLKVSRTLLFRALVNDQYAWDLATSSQFKGTIEQLLVKRFGLRQEPLIDVVPQAVLNNKIHLPDDAELVIKSMKPYLTALGDLTQDTRQGVTAYLKSIVEKTGDAKWLMLDLGYAGTIQKLITYIIEKDTDGLYLIATSAGKHQVGSNTANMRGLLKENIAWGQGYEVLEKSLFLETMMTAPHGQVVDIRQDSQGEFHFYYGRKAPTQLYAQDLVAVADGAIEAVVQQLRDGVSFTPEDIEAIYHAFVTPVSAIPNSVRHLFGIDDDFSGNGVLNPLAHFGL